MVKFLLNFHVEKIYLFLLTVFNQSFSDPFCVLMNLYLDICRQCNRRQIQGFRVEYVVVFAKKNNNYVETEMGL
jgi:hypothetical protein